MKYNLVYLILILTACGTSAPQSLTASEPDLVAQDLIQYGHLFPAKSLSALPPTAALIGSGWPAHYWPSSHWGLLWRHFNQSVSPLEKFEAAFGEQLGAANPNYFLGQLAQLESERVRNIAIPWSGICDGSSEASLGFSEPSQTKVFNGVTFHPFEQKALLAYFTAMSSDQRYWQFIGRRFDGGGGALVADPAFVDVNPGDFHLAITNRLGIQGKGLIADIVTGEAVLNYPVIGYRIHSQQQIPSQSERVVSIVMKLQYGESHRALERISGTDHAIWVTYTYDLLLSPAGYIIGGAWTGESIENHPDFLWYTEEPLKLANFTTTRLGRTLRVGGALSTLLQQPGAGMPEQLNISDDNLFGYRLFQGLSPELQLPVPEPVAAQLNSPF